ncbi:cohesin domain-containing protein [Botryobacter ruber]|uniref:cohesin domain-containing protein n=1 Tax=Botryobacter ruber TaxID=2171629 RepID=UPI000E0CA438|nr:cohesin domain-containing protein [Botryobacter ruber]
MKKVYLSLSFGKLLSFSQLILLFGLLAQPLMAQSPVTKDWDKRYGGTGGDIFGHMAIASDGGYLLAGSSSSGAGGDKTEDARGGTDCWVVKINSDGSKVWDKVYGGTGNEDIATVIVTPDGGYLLAGSSSSGIGFDKSEDSRGGSDYWLIKINADGSKVWDKRFGGTGEDVLWHIISTSDGGYLLGGSSSSGTGFDKSEDSRGGNDYWVIKISADGSKIWDKRFGGSGPDELTHMINTPDGSYLLGGWSESGITGDKTEASRGESDYWVVKISSDGSKAWDKTFGGSSSDRLYSLITTPGGGYLLGGESSSVADGDKTETSATERISVFWIIMLNADGSKAWDKIYENPDEMISGGEYLRSIAMTADGCYLLGGTSVSAAKNDKPSADYWVVKIYPNGSKAWDVVYGGYNWDNFGSLVTTTDGGFLVGGNAGPGADGDITEASRGGNDYWIVKATDTSFPLNSVTLITDSVSGVANSDVLVPVRVKDFKNILSMQGSIEWNSSIASFVGVESYGLPGLGSSNFGLTGVENGQLTFSWHEENSIPVTLSDDAVVFALKLKLIGAAGTSTAVSVTSTPVPVEVSDNTFTAIPVTIVAGAVSIQSEVTVSGTVRTPSGTPLDRVIVKAKGNSSEQNLTTSESGVFSFKLTGSSSYSLAPVKRNEVNVTNGITTLDILQIQRHILGLVPLNSPYKIIAADVNNSGSVTTMDIAYIRSLILYNSTSFPGNRTWAYVKSDFTFTDPSMPFPYDSTRTYSSVSELSNQDFTGIKLGDVNDTWDASTARLASAGNIAFNFKNQVIAPGTEIVVPVTVKDFTDVSGYQFTLNWDPKVLEFARVEHAGIEGAYGTHSVHNGRLTTLWTEPNGNSLSLENGSKIFQVRFKVIGKNGSESKVEVSSDLTNSLAYNGGLAELNVQSQHALVKVTELAYALHQNEPNPFTQGSTSIRFSIPQQEEVTISIYNSLGQEVRTYTATYAPGEHTITWDGRTSQGYAVGKGTYYYRMKAGKFTEAKRALLLEY